MDELADSTSLLNDQDGLCRRLADQPTPAEIILGPAARPPELFSRLFRGEPWWEPVPTGLTLYPRAQLVGVPPGPSRLIRVHPGWRHWQPPRAVH